MPLMRGLEGSNQSRGRQHMKDALVPLPGNDLKYP